MNDTTLIRVALLPGVEDAGRVVLSAAIQLFLETPQVEIELHVAGKPTADAGDAEAVSALVASVWPYPSLPEITVAGDDEVQGREPIVSVRAGSDATTNAQSILLLSAVAQGLWTRAQEQSEEAERAEPALEPPTATVDVPPPSPAAGAVQDHGWADVPEPPWVTSASARAARGLSQFEVARRDAELDVAGDLVVVVTAIRAVHWSSLHSIVVALSQMPGVELHVVESAYKDSPEDVNAMVRSAGVEPDTLEWFERNLERVHVVISDVPYDFEKPEVLTAPALAKAGVRQVYIPYGATNVGGDRIQLWVYRQPLQQLAWRIYLSSERGKEEMTTNSLIDAGHVRVLGLPKFDRLADPEMTQRARGFRKRARKGPVFLWNPHFAIGVPEPMSTFDLYAGELLNFFAARRDLTLIVRPHPTLWSRLSDLGGAAADMRASVTTFISKLPNVHLDESGDYLDAFMAADAMLSDASTLIPEFLILGKPVLFLRHPAGPPMNSDSDYIDQLPVAVEWAGVRSWLNATAATLARKEPLPRVDLTGHNVEPGAGARIAADIVAALENELRRA